MDKTTDDPPQGDDLKVHDEPAEPMAFEQLLQSARSGDESALGQLLENHRDYLLLIANEDMAPQIKGKIGSSDIVQETMLTAHQEFTKFHGDSKPQLLAWLRKIVRNDLNYARRAFVGTKKRQVDREKPLQYSSSIQRELVDPELTPSTNAMMAEEERLLKQAMQQLPDDYRKVLRLHSWEDLDLEVIAEKMARSTEAVRKLLARAAVRLSEELEKLRAG